MSGLKEAVYLGVVHKATCKQAANLLVIETDLPFVLMITGQKPTRSAPLMLTRRETLWAV